MSHPSEGLAPMGSAAESEVPRHAPDLDRVPGDPGDAPVEESPEYELAVEDGAPLAAGDAPDPGAGELAPRFTAPPGS